MDQNASVNRPVLRQIEVADRLHSAAIHLLRHVRRQDVASGLSAPRLSALSVIVFGGPVTMTELAQAEQVQVPTISRLVSSLEHDGLVERVADPSDGRVVRVRATPEGKLVLSVGRERRVRALGEQLLDLPPEELELLGRAADIVERITGDTSRHFPHDPHRPPLQEAEG